MGTRRRIGVWAGLAVLLGIIAVGTRADAVEPTVISGRATASTGISFDQVFVAACPPGTTHAFQPLCSGGVLASASAFNGWYSLTLPSGATGDWSVRAVGLFCASPALLADEHGDRRRGR